MVRNSPGERTTTTLYLYIFNWSLSFVLYIYILYTQLRAGAAPFMPGQAVYASRTVVVYMYIYIEKVILRHHPENYCPITLRGQ